MPRYGVHGPRYFALLSRVREAAPSKEWIREAKEEVKTCEAQTKITVWRQTGRGWRFTIKNNGR